jgi:hypothetical protein
MVRPWGGAHGMRRVVLQQRRLRRARWGPSLRGLAPGQPVVTHLTHGRAPARTGRPVGAPGGHQPPSAPGCRRGPTQHRPTATCPASLPVARTCAHASTPSAVQTNPAASSAPSLYTRLAPAAPPGPLMLSSDRLRLCVQRERPGGPQGRQAARGAVAEAVPGRGEAQEVRPGRRLQGAGARAPA